MFRSCSSRLFRPTTIGRPTPFLRCAFLNPQQHHHHPGGAGITSMPSHQSRSSSPAVVVGINPTQDRDDRYTADLLQRALREDTFRTALEKTIADSAAKTTEVVPPLTWSQWWKFGVRTAVPFFGFGLCDNLIMISVGDLIDTHFGVTLGFSTMVAAGLGQAVSDGSGITIQGMIEASSDRLRLPNPMLTDAQKALPRVQFWQQVFRTLGIVSGCLCGLIPVILFDTGNRPRLYDQLLSVLPEDQRRALSARATYVTIPEGTALFSYGAEADAMYLIVSGEVSVVGRTDNGEPIEFCRDGPGRNLGVLELVFGHSCVADVIASTPTVKLLRISREAFEAYGDSERIREVVTKYVEEDDTFVVYRARYLHKET